MIRTNSKNWVNHLQTTANLLNSQVNGTTKRTPDSVWKEGHEIQGEQDEEVIRLHEQRVINAVRNNPTTEYKVGDYVRVKMGTLYSKVRKQLKSGDRKLIVVNYSPTVYKINKVLKKDRADRRVGDTLIQYEKSRYTLSNLDGSPLASELKENNPNAVRKMKRFFASDMMLVEKPEADSFLKNFTVKDALELNTMDKKNEVAEVRSQPRPPPIVGAVLPIPAPRASPVPVPTPMRAEDLIGREVENTFQVAGKRKLFIGKIASYDKDTKLYTVEYEDGEEEYTLSQVKKFLKQDKSANVRSPRERRQVIVGGQVRYL